MLDKYYHIVADPPSSDVEDFLRWVAEDERYLGAAGNFALFCAAYFQASEDEAADLWNKYSQQPEGRESQAADPS